MKKRCLKLLRRMPFACVFFRRRSVQASVLYGALTLLYFVFADPARLTTHTPYNHFALLAQAWLDGHLALSAAPPAYAHGNDFALFREQWFIVFPPFPAILLVPFVALGGAAETVRDGTIFLWLAGAGPTLLFLALGRLADTGRSRHSDRTHGALAVLFALGTVYWFSAEQGTVWYAAHVVGVFLAALYLWASVGARSPLIAGMALALAFATRAPLIFAVPWFLCELARTAAGATPRSSFWRRAGKPLVCFAAPLALVLAATLWHNYARFAHPLEFGYRFLTIRWHDRIERYGLFSYHYLARNLAVLLTSLPFFHGVATPEAARWQVSGYGLALWVTTPVYLSLLRSVRWTSGVQRALLLTAAAVALPSLVYQSTGFVQFGYRYANDFAVFLFALLATGQRRFSRTFWALGVLGILVNGFGAVSFERPGWKRFYDLQASHVWMEDLVEMP